MMITPADSPSSPENYAAVPVQPMDIQAPQEDISGLVQAAGDLTGAGIIYSQSERQSQTEALLKSPPGYQEFTITGGWHDDFPADPTP